MLLLASCLMSAAQRLAAHGEGGDEDLSRGELLGRDDSDDLFVLEDSRNTEL